MYINILLQWNQDVANNAHHLIWKIKPRYAPFHLHCNHNIQSENKGFVSVPLH